MRTCFLWLLVLSGMCGVASAGTLSYAGAFNPNNANDVFMAGFTLGSTSSLNVQSYGYGGSSDAPGGTDAAGAIIASGGFDPYISLFFGDGPSATFVASNDDGQCGLGHPDPACEDSTLHIDALAAGDYVIVLTLPNNYSVAENYGFGTLGDGFIGLQSDFYDFASGEERTPNFAFDVTTGKAQSTAVTPEPSSFSLLFTGLLIPGFRSLSKRK